MSLFDKLFGSKKELTQKTDALFKLLNAYSPVFTTWSGGVYESELVRSAIRAKADHISKMNVKVIGSARPALQAKLRQGPNEFQVWSQFLARLATIYECNTTAYIVPVIDQFDETVGVSVVLPSQTEFVSYQCTPYLRYRFFSGDTAVIELSRCGIMANHQYRNDLTGDGNDALKDTMALINMQSQGIREGIKSAASYRFMANVTNFTRPEDLTAERKRFTEENLSGENGGLLLFPNTYGNIRQIDSKPFVVDADQMKLIQTNVFNYFGVNERIMQNIASPAELDGFYNGALEPFAIQLSEVLTKMLFSERERAQGTRVVVASDRLQYMSVPDKVNLIQTMGDRGMMTINEGRELMNLSPVENGDEMMPIRGEYKNASERIDDGQT